MPTFQDTLKAFKLREVGPAVMGGRISDIAVHPTSTATWYACAGSGGVWKTVNSGTTWTPIFDDQPSYSIGCVAIDPTHPDTVWVGTGENVSGRHVGWGHGVFRSRDGGKTWQQVGLDKSDHIGKILVHPTDSNTVYVAAEGPLWSSGGERGLYKTTDGGETWELILEIDADTGVNDIAFEPSNPEIIYASSYQRRRHVWSLVVGGGGSGIWKSADSGNTFRKLTTGLPKEDMGKIGLAVSAANPAILYATIEANKEEKGLYRSLDRGESWEKRCDYISGGTGPHYYQRIFASQTNADRVYQMDVFIHVSNDGGKTMVNMENGKHKHSDNHALWIDPTNPDHLIVGCDAGVYETYDHGATYRHSSNMPIAQFYRCAVDNADPFYNILGGAQDLGTIYGPSRTTNTDGIRNRDWTVPMGADGYHVAFDPTDNDIMYVEWQQGNLLRVDRRTMETTDIKPQPADGDPPERWNWDAPVIVSPHAPSRIYYASQRVWRSDDRGDSWTPISGDLSRGTNRYELPVGERIHSVNDLYDNGAMSGYANITNLSESALVEGLIYAATDDGLIQVTSDDGTSWQRCAALPDVAERAFIQSVRADQHDADTVFAIADVHKLGDYDPYIFESNDRGQTWRSIKGDLPDGTILWAVEQDHVKPELLFAAAEFGIYVTVNRGETWHKLAGAPTIAFRDLKLQRRDNDLVGASFGRGFYVLDDYAPLREITDETLEQTGAIFPVRDAWWYVPYTPMQSRGAPTQGSTAYRAKNPDFGATIRYYLKEKLSSTKDVRREAEKELTKEKKDVAFPGFDVLTAEADESDAKALILIRDAAGNGIRWLDGSTEAGLHSVTWDLRLAPPDPVDLSPKTAIEPWRGPAQGPLVAPGVYSAEFHTLQNGTLTQHGEPQLFTIKPVPALAGNPDFAAAAAFKKEVLAKAVQLHGVGKEIGRTESRLKHLQAALLLASQPDTELFAQVDTLTQKLTNLKRKLYGSEIRSQLNEPNAISIAMRIGRVVWMDWNTTQMPTANQRDSYAIGAASFDALLPQLRSLIDDELAVLEAAVAATGAPWTPGRKL